MVAFKIHVFDASLFEETQIIWDLEISFIMNIFSNPLKSAQQCPPSI